MTFSVKLISYLCPLSRSPAMSGGIFAIRRHYFNEIGQYDKDMDFWGGESLELSVRVLQILFLK